MKQFKKELDRLTSITFNRYNDTIDYVANYLKPFGKKGLPIVWSGGNYVADAVYDDCECVRYEINAIRATNKPLPHSLLEAHAVMKNNDVCDEWIEIDDFDIETIFYIFEWIRFEENK